MTTRLLIGDVHERLAELPDGSVDLFVTSPPFLALRSYLPANHPDKAREIGSEATPAAFLDTLLQLTAEFRRVLAPHGSICVELGDTYAGSGGAGGDYGPDGPREGQPKFRQMGTREHRPPGARPDGGGGTGGERERSMVNATPLNAGPGWPLDKSLSGIPTLYTWSLAYGRNLLNPAHELDRWRIRNLLTWCRPNPPVGALGDKFRPATSFVTVATMGRDRWFDLDAVRTEGVTGDRVMRQTTPTFDPVTKRLNGDPSHGERLQANNPAGAPPLDWDAPDQWDALFADALDDFLAGWWQPLIDLPTQPYKGAHYATFSLELPKRLIEAMCPRQVCRDCGEPRRRIVGAGDYGEVTGKWTGDEYHGRNVRNPITIESQRVSRSTTLGWSDCGHGDDWRPGIVCDPFAGSGTTLAAAIGVGRDAIGIDLDDRNLPLTRTRIRTHVYVRHETRRATGRWFAGAYSSWNRGRCERRPLSWTYGEWVADPRVPRPKGAKRFDPKQMQRSLFDELVPS